MKAPLVEQAVGTSWREIRDLYYQLLKFLYKKEDSRQARRIADRMEPLLTDADPRQEAIFGQECRSLIYEARGDLPKAIRYRKNEIDLIRKLHAIAREKPCARAALEDYGFDDLAERLNLLAALYHDKGNLGQAIQILEESRQLCAEQEIKFQATDVLKRYLAERRNGES